MPERKLPNKTDQNTISEFFGFFWHSQCTNRSTSPCVRMVSYPENRLPCFGPCAFHVSYRPCVGPCLNWCHGAFHVSDRLPFEIDFSFSHKLLELSSATRPSQMASLFDFLLAFPLSPCRLFGIFPCSPMHPFEKCSPTRPRMFRS